MAKLTGDPDPLRPSVPGLTSQHHAKYSSQNRSRRSPSEPRRPLTCRCAPAVGAPRQRSREALFTLGTRLDYHTILLCDERNKPDTSCEPAERRTGEGPATRRVTYWFLPSRTRCLAAAQKCPPPLWLSPPARAHG